jgi:hypothetical protein
MEGLVSMFGKWTMIAAVWIKSVINIAVEVVGAMEPGTGSDEDASREPLRSVISVWSAVVWGKVEIAIRANRRWSDIDGDLGWRGA